MSHGNLFNVERIDNVHLTYGLSNFLLVILLSSLVILRAWTRERIARLISITVNYWRDCGKYRNWRSLIRRSVEIYWQCWQQ